MRPLAVIALLLTACPAPVTNPDLASSDDAGTVIGIACGRKACYSMAQICCTSDNGISGTCDSVLMMTCSSSQFACDGPEDCAPATPVCCVKNGVAQCVDTGLCGTTTTGTIMCHIDADCGGPNFRCCRARNGSPYSLCLDSSCP